VDKRRCAWCGTDNDPARTSCTSCGTRLTPLQEGEPIWAVPPESVAPVPPPSTEGWGVGPQSGTPPVPAAPPGILQSTAAVAYPPQPLPPPNWAPPATWQGSVPKASSSMPGGLWAAIAVVVLAAMGFFLFQKMQSAISFPDTIAGYQHDDSQIAKAATEFLEKTLDGVGIEAKAAIYGDIAKTGFMVIAFETSGTPLPGTLEDFATGFAGTSGGSVDTGKAVTETRDGVTYRCASINMNRPASLGDPQAVCMWNDDDTGGFVITAISSNTEAAVDLAANVHDGVVG